MANNEYVCTIYVEDDDHKEWITEGCNLNNVKIEDGDECVHLYGTKENLLNVGEFLNEGGPSFNEEEFIECTGMSPNN
jgi:hypothetical protein